MKTFAATLAAVSAIAGAASAQNVDWRAAGQQDLQAMHDALAENHPAAVLGDGQAAFRTQLAGGLEQGQARLGEVRDALDYAYLLRGYARGFRDANISIQPNWQAAPAWDGVAWTNFTTGWRNGQYVVTWVKPGERRLPPVGAQLVSCDGVPADQFARNRLDGWEGDLTLEADRVMTAPYLFWDRGNPFVGGLPAECEFRDGRRTRDYRLSSSFASEPERRAAWQATVYTPQTPLGLEDWNGGKWIHMHSLAADAGWDAFFAQVEAQREALRAAPVVVIDLRGAGAGGAEYGYRLANWLWGVDFRLSRQPNPGEIAYRVSPANRQFFVDALGRMQADPVFAANYPGTIAEMQAVIAAFDAAAAAGQATFTRAAPNTATVSAVSAPAPVSAEGEDPEAAAAAQAAAPAAPAAAPTNPVQGRVVVLVDAACRGGCLDTVDVLLTMPNVQLAGQPTGADSIFIEPTRLALPSGNAWLDYGHKAWLGRARATNQPHTPQAGLTYSGDPTDENAVRAWLAGVIGG